MATLTIRRLPADLVERIRERAMRAGRSMEQEVRLALADRYADRQILLDRIERQLAELPPTTAAEVDQWIEEGREGRPWRSSSTPTS